MGDGHPVWVGHYATVLTVDMQNTRLLLYHTTLSECELANNWIRLFSQDPRNDVTKHQTF
jgi:hypothetical protein